MGPFELRLFHYAIWPILLMGLCRWWFGPVARLSFAWVFLGSWLVLIHAQAAEVYLTSYRHLLFLIAVWVTPLGLLLVAGPLMQGLGHRVPPLRGIDPHGPRTARDQLVVRLSPWLTAALWGLISIYIVDIGLRNVALFFVYANPGSIVEGMSLRIAGLTSNISPVLSALYGYARTLFIPLYAAIATAFVVSGRMRVGQWALVILGSATFSLLTAAKAPLAYTLGAAALAGYLSRPERVGLARIALGLVVVLLLPALVYPLVSGDRGTKALEVAVSNLWRRVTVVTSETGAIYFDAFPALHNHQGASSNRILAVAANVPATRTPNYIYDRYLDPDAILPGGTVNTAFFASFYADWGEAGIGLGVLVAAFTVLGLQLFFDRRRARDATVAGVHATTMIALVQMMSSDFYGVALGRGLLSLPLFLWGFDLLVATLDRTAVPGRSVPAPAIPWRDHER